MSLTSVFAVAMALAMDAFAVAIATGLRLRRVSARQTFRMAWHFGLFQALMPIIGWAIGTPVRAFTGPWVNWVAFALLAFVGARMIKESFASLAADPRDSKDPTRGGSLVMPGLATSLDALAVGLSLSLIGTSIWKPALVIGVVCLVLTAAGLYLGRLFMRSTKLSMLAGRIGGLVLVIVGLDVLRAPAGLG